MYKRLPYLALAMLSLAFATSLRAGPLGAMLVSWDIDSTKNMVTLHMVNNSGKDITFLNVSIKETYAAGGVNEHQFSQEMPDVSFLFDDPTYPPHEALRQLYHGGNGTWQAGTNRDVKIAVQPGLMGFEAVIDAVTYLDNTAEGSNHDALAREADARKGAAETLRATNEVIRKALANNADKSPHETAAREIEKNHADGTSTGVAADLREAPEMAAHLKQSLHDYLAGMIARNEKLAAKSLASATPRVGGAQ